MISHASRTAVERFAYAVKGRLDGSPLAVMLDIDGTLAPIAPTPARAVVPPETESIVRKLTELPDVHVALVSGRSVADASRMLRVEDAWIIGNHGLEICEPHGVPAPVGEAIRYEGVIAKASRFLDAIARTVPGAFVENKRWTLCLHYRLVDPSLTSELIGRAHRVAQDLGLRATEGKRVVDLRPLTDVNKGTAATAFAARVGALDRGSTLYAGDDSTDEDAFLALKGGASRAVTVRVLDVEEGDVPTEAEYSLASPAELRAALEWLVARRSATLRLLP